MTANPTPHSRTLLMAGIGILASLVLPWLASGRIAWTGLLVTIAFALCDWLYPALTAPLWRLLQKTGERIGQASSLLFAALFYIMVIVPVGVAMQWHAALTKSRPVAGSDSYYLPPEGRRPEHMKRTF